MTLDHTLAELFNYTARANRPRCNSAGNFTKDSIDEAAIQLRKLSTTLSQYKADLRDTELVIMLTEADITQLLNKYRSIGEGSRTAMVKLICSNIVEDLRTLIARKDNTLNLTYLL